MAIYPTPGIMRGFRRERQIFNIGRAVGRLGLRRRPSVQSRGDELPIGVVRASREQSAPVMRRARWAGPIMAAAVLQVASPARAFVRETTSYASGVPVSWPTACVRLAVGDPASPSLAWQDLLSATASAADTWNAAAASCGGGFQFVVEKAQYSPLAPLSDGVNAVLFEPHDYCGGGSSAETCDPLSLSITWRQASPDGQLHEADIVVNGEAYQWGLEGDGAAGTMDLQSALTHELGHALGLDHNCYISGYGLPRPTDDQGSPIPDCGAPAPVDITSSVMYPPSGGYGIDRRVLSDDDLRGICAIYLPGRPPACEGNLAPSGGCALAGGTSSSPSWPRFIDSFLVFALFFLRRPTRRTGKKRPSTRRVRFVLAVLETDVIANRK